MKSSGASDQCFLSLDIVRIGYAAIYRANGGASLMVVKPYAFCAEPWVDDVKLFSLRNGVVRTFGLASATIDAFAGNHRRHDKLEPPSIVLV